MHDRFHKQEIIFMQLENWKTMFRRWQKWYEKKKLAIGRDIGILGMDKLLQYLRTNDKNVTDIEQKCPSNPQNYIALMILLCFYFIIYYAFLLS